jgi:ribosomal protein S18 acetylase RimI-like enzyme
VCGDAEYARPPRRWLSQWIWEKKPLTRKGETVIVVDNDREGLIVGYGTWAHVADESSVLKPLQIEIAWLAVHSEYQRTPFDEQHTVADVVYAEVERFAREHPDSLPDMAITLTCHIDNRRALDFYEKNGFRMVPDPKLQVENDIYYRLVR